MNQRSRIVIPSKGRAGSAKTITLLIEAGLTPTVFVEPQELEAYSREYGGKIHIHELAASDQGIGYVRQFILDHARKEKWPAYWMLDDDITGFFTVENGKTVRTPAPRVLDAAEKIFLGHFAVAQGALEYQQFAWAAKSPRKFNGYCDVAVWINVEKTRHVNYRRQMDLKEDRDFTLQILASGYNTMRASWCAFSAPKNGSNAGGLQETYQQNGREAEASRRMIAAWPGVCSSHVKPDGRPDVKINWAAFKVQKQD
jgi:hypothetical protein